MWSMWLRTLEKWLRNTSKKDFILACVIGIYFGSVLWITLLCRDLVYTHRFITLFWSYQRIFAGDKSLLIENFENVIMFIPMGYFLQMLQKKRWKEIAVAAVLVSLGIELMQYITTLGIFEVDDVIHNTIGALLGYLVYKIKPMAIHIKCKRVVIPMAVSAALTLSFWFGLAEYKEYINQQRMVPYAALNDSDGRRNLLIPFGEDGYCWNTAVYVKYIDDGSIKISGESDRRSWFMIAELKLEPGEYIFKGLSGVDENTVAIELEYFDKDEHDYIRLTPYIGPIDSTEFTLRKMTKIRAYVGVYPGCECDVTARPVIYRMGD